MMDDIDQRIAAMAEAISISTTAEPATAPVSTAATLTWPDMGAICRQQPGRYSRIVTGCTGFDALLGGGLQTRRTFVLGGAPGGNKTSLTVRLLWDMAKNGTLTTTGVTVPVHCHYYATDESGEGILSRVAQMEHITRAALEDDDMPVARAAWESAAVAMEAVPGFRLWDPRMDTAARGVAFEQVAMDAHKRARADGARLVLAIDSIQTATFACDASPDGRERTTLDLVKGRMNMARTLSQELDACIVILSELNRPGYATDATPGLGSFKESGSVEYWGDVPITMRKVKDEPGVIEVVAQKNRLNSDPAYEKGIRLRRGPWVSFDSVDMPPAEDRTKKAAQKTAAQSAEVRDRLREIIKMTLASQKPITAQKTYFALLGDSPTTRNAIALGEHLGALVKAPGKSGAYSTVPTALDNTEPATDTANEWGAP